MNNKLQALERAKTEHSIIKQGFSEQEYIKTLDEIEKSLEALEILRNKKVNLEYLKCCDTYEQYKTICSYWNEIIKQEFDLLKEILTCTNV